MLIKKWTEEEDGKQKYNHQTLAPTTCLLPATWQCVHCVCSFITRFFFIYSAKVVFLVRVQLCCNNVCVRPVLCMNYQQPQQCTTNIDLIYMSTRCPRRWTYFPCFLSFNATVIDFIIKTLSSFEVHAHNYFSIKPAHVFGLTFALVCEKIPILWFWTNFYFIN